MQGAGREIRAGWVDVRWLVYFALLLPLVLIPVAAVAYLVTPPAPLAAAFSGILVAAAVLVTLILAGLLDGPDGRLGPIVWGVALGVAAIWLFTRVEREIKRRLAEEERTLGRSIGATMRVSFGGHAFTLTWELTPEAATIRIWRVRWLRRVHQSIIDQINQPAPKGADKDIRLDPCPA